MFDKSWNEMVSVVTTIHDDINVFVLEEMSDS